MQIKLFLTPNASNISVYIHREETIKCINEYGHFAHISAAHLPARSPTSSCAPEFQISKQVKANRSGRTFICQSAIIGFETADGQNGRDRVSPGLQPSPLPLCQCWLARVRMLESKALYPPLWGFLYEVPRLGTAIHSAWAKVSLCGQHPATSQCFIFSFGRKRT